MPPPVPPSVKLGRMSTGKPSLLEKSRPSRRLLTSAERGNIEADADHRVLEEQAVFGFLDGFELGADQLDVVAVENAGVGEIDGEVEGGLAADGGQQSELARARRCSLSSISASMRMISSTYSWVSGSM